MICRSCGKEIADDTRFCPNCGQDQSPDAPLRSQVPPQVPPPPQDRGSPVLRGMGYTFGACLLLVLASLVFVLFLLVIVIWVV